MRLFNHHFLRIFVALLITVFITNTVYAGSMMVSASFNSIAVSTSAQAVSELTEGHHCHDHARSDQYHSHNSDSEKSHHYADALISQQSHDQSPSHGGCSHCNDCLACYSMMLYDQVNVASISSQPVLAIATHVLYLAPTNPQPNKPPIS
jgi:hypothetical protein